MNVSEKVIQWQQCPHTAMLTCSMDTDHPPLELRESRGRTFLQCPLEECGFIRYDINQTVLTMVHGEKHRGCYYVT